MAVNRKFLNWGVFFISVGAVVLVAQVSGAGSAAIAEAMRYWPVLVIALGAGLVLRQTRLSLAGGMLAAATPGLLLGGAIVAAPDMPGDCRHVTPTTLETRQGTFAASAVVDLDLSCGDAVVTTSPGSAWEARTGNGRGDGPVVTSDAGRLAIASTSGGHRWGFGRGADEWRLSLPTATELDLDAGVNAGHGTFDLGGARLGEARFVVNAADATIDLGGARASRLSVRANAARVGVTLPDADLGGELAVNAGAIQLCVPSDLGLRIRETSTLAGFSHPGLVQRDGAWETANYATAVHHADVSVTANVGSVDVNPEGGCR